MGLWRGDATRLVGVQNPTADHGTYGGPPRPITPENVSFNNFDPVTISPDGKSAAVANLDGKIVLYPLDNGAPRTVSKLADGFAPLRWCTGDSLMVYQRGDVPVKILRVDIETGAQTLWKELAPAYRTGLAGIADVRVGADCQSSAYSAQYLPSELWIASGLR